MLFEPMIMIATFDILPTDDIFPKMFPDLGAEEPFSDKFDEMDYGT